MIKQDCLDAIEHLDEWASPEYVEVGLAHKLNRCHIRKDPVGKNYFSLWDVILNVIHIFFFLLIYFNFILFYF
jgi:hypothetical protein